MGPSPKALDPVAPPNAKDCAALTEYKKTCMERGIPPIFHRIHWKILLFLGLNSIMCFLIVMMLK